MKNTLFLTALLSIVGLQLHAAEYKKQVAQDMKIFFDYAKEHKIALESGNPSPVSACKTYDQKTLDAYNKKLLNTYTIIEIISSGDIDLLKKTDVQDLDDMSGGQIWVPASYFKDDMGGRLESKIIGAQNALGYVVLHSALDTTEKDQARTIEMLQVLLNKKVDINAKIGIVLWLKNNPSDEYALDYVGYSSPVEAAIQFSTPAVVELLLKHGAEFDHDDVSKLLDLLKNCSSFPAEYLQAFEKLLQQHPV